MESSLIPSSPRRGRRADPTTERYRQKSARRGRFCFSTHAALYYACFKFVRSLYDRAFYSGNLPRV
jgi:hypothetical protein